MLRAWQLGDRQNDTLLQEAKAAFSQMHRGGMHANWSSGARGNDYEAANGAIGMVAQAMLWKISGGQQEYLDGCTRPSVTGFLTSRHIRYGGDNTKGSCRRSSQLT